MTVDRRKPPRWKRWRWTGGVWEIADRWPDIIVMSLHSASAQGIFLSEQNITDNYNSKTIGITGIVPDIIGVNKTLGENMETCHLLKLPEHLQLTNGVASMTSVALSASGTGDGSDAHLMGCL